MIKYFGYYTHIGTLLSSLMLNAHKASFAWIAVSVGLFPAFCKSIRYDNNIPFFIMESQQDLGTFEFKGQTYQISRLTDDQRAVLSGLEAAQEHVKSADERLQLLMIARDSLFEKLDEIVSSL